MKKLLLLMSICLSAFLTNAQDTTQDITTLSCKQLNDLYTFAQKLTHSYNESKTTSPQKTENLEKLSELLQKIQDQKQIKNCPLSQ